MLEFILDIAERLNLNVAELGIGLAIIVALIVGMFLLNAWRRSSYAEQYAGTLDLLTDILWAAMAAAEGDTMDLTPYLEEVERRAAEGLPYIDHRMLYVMDMGERWLASQGYTIDAEELLTRAQGLFNLIKGLLPSPVVIIEETVE